MKIKTRKNLTGFILNRDNAAFFIASVKPFFKLSVWNSFRVKQLEQFTKSRVAAKDSAGASAEKHLYF